MKNLNNISYETTEPILMKFHISIYMMVVQNLDKKGNDSKFKVAAMPTYGKRHSNDFFSRTTRPIWLVFWRKHMGHLSI